MPQVFLCSCGQVETGVHVFKSNRYIRQSFLHGFWLQVMIVNLRYTACLDRTLWLTHLPVGDNLTGKYFHLSEEDGYRSFKGDRSASMDTLGVYLLNVIPCGQWFSC